MRPNASRLFQRKSEKRVDKAAGFVVKWAHLYKRAFFVVPKKGRPFLNGMSSLAGQAVPPREVQPPVIRKSRGGSFNRRCLTNASKDHFGVQRVQAKKL